jgi:hypothetical protein
MEKWDKTNVVYMPASTISILKTYGPRSNFCAGRQWLTPIILAIQEAEIRRIMVPSQTDK